MQREAILYMWTKCTERTFFLPYSEVLFTQGVQPFNTVISAMPGKQLQPQYADLLKAYAYRFSWAERKVWSAIHAQSSATSWGICCAYYLSITMSATTHAFPPTPSTITQGKSSEIDYFIRNMKSVTPKPWINGLLFIQSYFLYVFLADCSTVWGK